MREIKFRAWDNKKKEWLLGYELKNLGGFSLFGELMLLGEWSGILNTFLFSRDGYTPDDLKVMQFTGIHDKNGKEIYEDDIVRYPSKRVGAKRKDVEIGLIEYGPEDLMYWITHLNGDAKCFTGTENLYFGNTVNGEVIGNIHENPELLTPSTPSTKAA
jgi:uncharacterized phage protein (TIGR01671 family)